MNVLFDLLLKLINQFDGYKSIIGGIVVGVSALAWIANAIFLHNAYVAEWSASLFYFGLSVLGVGWAHKATKAALKNSIKIDEAKEVKEAVLALIQSANTIADVTKERFNLDKFIKEHLDEIIKLVPLITTAIQDSAKVVEELKVLSHEDEQWIINELVRLDFPDDKAQELAKSGIKALLYLAQLGSRLR